MITEQQLTHEIDMIVASMFTAADSQREYSIGALSALLWVQGGGEVMRPTCFMQACQAWDKARFSAPEDDQRYSVITDLADRADAAAAESTTQLPRISAEAPPLP